MYARKVHTIVKEISIMVARNSDGQIVSFPVAENIHNKNILT